LVILKVNRLSILESFIGGESIFVRFVELNEMERSQGIKKRRKWVGELDLSEIL